MSDRAQQALQLLALLPVAETTADPNSYGFRPKHSCTDAIGQCFISLAKSYSPKWILEADIKSCFDEISHPWMLENIPMDKRILKAWLNAGYMEGGRVYPTKAGSPQGGIASPVLANMTLDGLEQVCRKAAPTRHQLGGLHPKVNVIRYADDFIVTAGSRRILEDNIVPAIRKYLKERGLRLSEEKTRITHIEEGFDFLGQNVRKHQNKLSINPSKKSVRSILDKTKEIIKAHRGDSAWHMIKKLNKVIRGWANYHRHVYASETFSYLDTCIFRNLWNWARRRHKEKGKRWTRKKYFREYGSISWSFFATQISKDGCIHTIDLLRACTIKTIPHVKIRAQANPYCQNWDEYFQKRKKEKDL
jgi:RNA-directed DNA polymerase